MSKRIPTRHFCPFSSLFLFFTLKLKSKKGDLDIFFFFQGHCTQNARTQTLFKCERHPLFPSLCDLCLGKTTTKKNKLKIPGGCKLSHMPVS